MKRPFTGLRKREPHERYDAVVIGAGIGGLVLANLLAKDGLSVLLTEQHYMVGGYCSTFRRAGYTFDAATHFYPLLGNPETMTGKLLKELGVETEWVRMDPVDTFHFPDGSRFEVPAEMDDYRAKLDNEFPELRAEMDAFFAEAREAYLLGLLEYFRNRRVARLDAFRDLTVRQALDKHFPLTGTGDDEARRKLKLLLTADCPHWGSAPENTSFVFDSMLRLSYFLGNYYPVGGSQAFADELARCFEDRGGDILMSSRVEKIRVEDGRAVGVRVHTDRGNLKGTREIDAEVVISNADLGVTLDELLGEERVDPLYRERVAGLTPSFPCFLTHVGLEGVSDEALDHAQGYYWNDWDPDKVGRNGLRCKIFSPTLYEPRMAPPGKQVVILQKVLEMDADTTDSWSPEQWAAHKEEIGTYVLDHFKAVVPEARDKIVVHTSASALTSYRFTLNRGGAMLGWTMSPEQLGDARPGIESPVKNLYLVGHWTRPGGGITPVIVSAVHVAKAVARESSARSRTVPSPEALARPPDPSDSLYAFREAS